MPHLYVPPCVYPHPRRLSRTTPGPGRGRLSCSRMPGLFRGLSVPADLDSSSVRAGLQSLETSGRLEDEFDMFALTRGSSLADQRKE